MCLRSAMKRISVIVLKPWLKQYCVCASQKPEGFEYSGEVSLSCVVCSPPALQPLPIRLCHVAGCCSHCSCPSRIVFRLVML